MRAWGDEIRQETDAELRRVTELHGEPYPDITDASLEHDQRIAAADRLYEKGGQAYTEAPSDRERREHRDEQRVRNTLHPRTGNVTVQPRSVPCTCGAAARGLRLAGPAHRYACPLYSNRVDPELEAA